MVRETGVVEYDAIVLAGGRSRRLGGVDKTTIDIGGVPMLDRVLAACDAARTIIAVGDTRPTARPVRWTVENPRFGGPLAALGSGMAALPDDATNVVALAADLPYLTADDIARLLDALPGHDAAVFVDETGTRQPLAGAYHASRLAAALAQIGDLSGQPVRGILNELRAAPVPDHGAARDCDTTDQVEAARKALR